MAGKRRREGVGTLSLLFSSRSLLCGKLLAGDESTTSAAVATRLAHSVVRSLPRLSELTKLTRICVTAIKRAIEPSSSVSPHSARSWTARLTLVRSRIRYRSLSVQFPVSAQRQLQRSAPVCAKRSAPRNTPRLSAAREGSSPVAIRQSSFKSRSASRAPARRPRRPSRLRTRPRAPSAVRSEPRGLLRR